MSAKDTYKSIAKPSPEILFKEKKSKFYGYAFPIIAEEDVKPILDRLRKKHHAANHVCYAWQLGTAETRYRANDDGEPNNSAGMPIYGQIQSYGVTNILVAVVRIFGGTKLGVGGLISAYRKAAQLALEESRILELTMMSHIHVNFDYSSMNRVMRVIKQNRLEIVSQQMGMDCNITVRVAKSKSQHVLDIFNVLTNIKAVAKSD